MRLIFVFLFTFLCVDFAHADSFFGVNIGEPYSLRKCDDNDLNFQKNDSKDGYCSFPFNKTNLEWGETRYEVFKPAKIISPSWFKGGGGGFTVSEFEGKVVSIGVSTQGWDSQLSALKDLIEKFGKPTSRKNTRMINNFGVTFDVITAVWKKPTYTVTLRGVDSDDKDHGNVTIETKDDALMEQRKKEWMKLNLPKAKM